MQCASALYSVVQDCDEVFNYWEPTHYLLEGYGFQTWEYSPEYRIRSWAFILLYTIVGFLSKIITSTKLQIFYLVRLSLAGFCSFAEAKFYRTVVEEVNPHVGRYVLVILFFSAGMFHASTAFLPSSFAMYTTMMAFSSILKPVTQMERTRTYASVFWLVLGGIAWPFSGAIGIPFALEELIVFGRDTESTEQGQLKVAVRSNTWRWKRLIRLGEALLLSSGVLCGLMTLFDSYVYQQFSFVPWNIVNYNVLHTDSQHGPDIFGTEPWYFYLLNGVLNFNIAFILAIVSGLVLLITAYVDRHRIPGSTWKEAVWPYVLMSFKLAPFYIWFLIFTTQAHKEERFLYVSYPLLALNAGICIYLLRSLVGRAARGLGADVNIRAYLLRYTSIVILFVYSLISISRILALLTRYHAPMAVYASLWNERQDALIFPNTLQEEYDTNPMKKELQVCVGKEWYRYQSSFFLPKDVRLRFISSEFNGLLPNTFPEDWSMVKYSDNDSNGEKKDYYQRSRSFNVLKGMRQHHEGTNDQNKKDDSVLLKDIQQCDYLIDSYFPLSADNESEKEPHYILDSTHWDQVYCEPYLDAFHSKALARSFWVPGSQGLTWGEYCLLKRKL
ncbi:unnamed protein product [Cunninghamella echinulata]